MVGVKEEEWGGDVIADNAEARSGRFFTGVDEITVVPPEASCTEHFGCIV